MYPFSHVNFKFGGKVASCFRSKPMHNAIETPGADLWNAPELRQLRQELVGGERSKTCANCWKLEEGGGFSYRQESLRDSGIHAPFREAVEGYDPATGVMHHGPAQVEIRLSSLCNLTCRMCSPEYSSKWGALIAKNPELQPWQPVIAPEVRDRTAWTAHEKLILDFVEKNKSTLKYVMFSGGEPLMQKSHYAALKALHPFEKEITLEYTTNLNTLRSEHENVFDYWNDFKTIRLKISLDGDPEIYPFVRVGGSIAKIEENLRALQARYSPEQMMFLGTCTVSVYNIYRLPEIARYFTRLGLFFHTSQVQEPAHQSSQCLPSKAKARVSEKLNAFLENVKRELEQDFNSHPAWEKAEARATQVSRIRRFVGNSVSYMNARGDSADFEKLQQFENLFAKASASKSFAQMYPELMSDV